MDQQQWLEWMQWRRKGLGGSDAPVIMGCHVGRKSLDSLRKEKLFGISDQKETPAMRRGKELESEALRWFMEETGIFMEEQKCYEHPERSWMRCTVDGINEKEGVLVEIKVPTGDLYDEVPKPYVPQCQHTMEVVASRFKDIRFRKMFLVSYNERGGKIIETSSSEEYTKIMVEKEEAFWNEIQMGYKNMEHEKHWKKIRDDLEIVRNGLEAAKMIYEDQIKGLKETEALLLSDAILHANGVPAEGFGLILQQKIRLGLVDAEKIKKETGVDIELFRKEPKYNWSIDIVKNT